MILGFVATADLFTNEKNKKNGFKYSRNNLYQRTLALTVGLMLTIGNFLGGQWANESWGRYWDGTQKRLGH
jgi:hypothetical protein